ncbi:MAG: VWA domain-containing protein, partial [Alphaproteobacteria bacterium]
MFSDFFFTLRKAEVPVSLREYLDLLGAMDKGLAQYDVEEFYYLSRAILVKDERHIDKF